MKGSCTPKPRSGDRKCPEIKNEFNKYEYLRPDFKPFARQVVYSTKTHNMQQNSNQPFKIKTKLADIIQTNYRLIPVIGRFGIKFGFGNGTVQEVCETYEVNPYFFLEIINSYHNHQYFPKHELQDFDTREIIRYLSKTHDYYRDVKLPEIQAYIDQMLEKAEPGNLKNIQLIDDFFKAYAEELRKHLLLEDEEVFPYVVKLKEAIAKKEYPESLIQHIQQSSIEEYERDHSDVEEKLGDLTNLIIKFLPPVLCENLIQQLLIELFRLEDDIHNHSRIEDTVLVPKVKLLEEIVLHRGK